VEDGESESGFSLEGKGGRSSPEEAVESGRATALGFAQAGADVVVASRKLPDLEKSSMKSGNRREGPCRWPRNVGKWRNNPQARRVR